MMIFFALILFPLFSSNLAYGIIDNGTFRCTDDLKNELHFYLDIKKATQSRVDSYLEQRPGDFSGAQNYLNNILKNDVFGISLNQSKECLQSLGYDTSTLNPIAIPEFGSSTNSIILISIIVTIIVSSKLRLQT